jgi:lipopolysaccharide export system permease protein
MLVMGFTVLGQLPIILSLSLFIAMVSTLSQHVPRERDGHLVRQRTRPVQPAAPACLRFAWPVMAVIACSRWQCGHGPITQIQELKTQYEQRSDIDRIAPGEFQESANGHPGLLHRQGHS